METPQRVGRYELLERLDQGGMGVLYRGRDTLLGREVAVKVMAPGLLGDAAAHARFFREAKAVARLQHINIVTIFEFGEHEETPYIVMEFLRGGTLAERLKQDPPLSLHDKLDTAIQLCAGLEAAHSQGVVHRAVTPANLWICDDGTVKLLDFGISTAASSSATFADVLGNPGYLSPEQITSHEVDRRTDIYSVGAILYEMATGRRPFEADSPTDVMLKIVNESPPPIVEPGLPADLTAAIVQAMAKSPSARYARAADLGRDLRDVETQLPIPAEPAGLIEETVLHSPPAPDFLPVPAAPDDRRPLEVPEREAPTSRIPLGRSELTAIALLVAIAVAAMAWYLWAAK